MPSSLACLRLLGYAATILLHGWNIVILSLVKFEKIPDEDVKRFGSLQYRYFTCWTFFLQLVHAVLGVSCELLIIKNSNKKNYKLPKQVRGARDTLFSSIVFPCTFLTLTVFWSLFLYNRDLILPAFVDQVLTPTNNHIMHTLIIPLTLWEVMFQPRFVPKSHIRNLGHLLFVMLLYFCVLLYTYIERGIWIYPIFGYLMGTIYFYPSFLIIFSLSFVFYYLQWILTTAIWGNYSVESSKKLH